MAGIDLNRTTSGLVLPPSVSNEIWSKAGEDSVVMQAATRIDLPGNGASIPMISGEAAADWVAETDEKPVSRPTLANKQMSAYKIAVIVPFSNELRRDANALYNTVIGSLPNALAKVFDETVFGFRPAPGSNFDTLAASPTTALGTDIYASLVSALATVGGNGGGVSAWILGLSGEVALLGATGADGRPLFTSDAASGGSIGNALGRPVYRSKHAYNNPAAGADIVGFAGDWLADARWGQVEGITLKVSDQATIKDGATQLNLWQRNMSAALAEVEVGFRVTNANRFTKLTGATTP